MSHKQPGLIRRLLGWIWDALNFSRRLVLNVLFVFVMIFVLAAILAPKPRLQEGSALVIAPVGNLVEQYSVDPASRALAKALGSDVPEVQLRDLLRAIDAARDDDRIQRIYLRTDGLASAGLASLREVAAALREFRASGKQVVAYAHGMDQRGYLLAAAADEVYLHPSGAVLLEGFAAYRPYYREGLQDKLGVDVHLFRVGEYKSAAEPFIRDSASEEDREANLFWMQDLWDRHLAEIATARGLDAAELQAGIDALPERVRAVGGDLGRLAVEQGLVDALKTAEEVDTLMAERGHPGDDGQGFRQVSMDDYLGFVGRERRMALRARPQVAVIVAQGAITGGDQPPGQVGGESTSALLREARFDDNVKAVVLRVDSPGGGVFPSEQIRREVELLQAAGKPVVASMGDVAASGGYWISMNADAIYADASTITGSIGIFGLWLTTPRTLEMIGVRVDGVGTTRVAGAFDPTRPLNPLAAETIQSVIEQGYAEFIGKVAHARDSSPEAIDLVARGRVWSGAQAKDRGLVDELGGLREAITRAAELAGHARDEVAVRYIERPLSTFERFMASLGGSARGAALLRHSGLARVMLGDRTVARIEQELGWLEARQNNPLQGVAHCFCGF